MNLAEDEELLRQMREAHFTRVFLGIETPVAESLKETTKFQNLRKDLLRERETDPVSRHRGHGRVYRRLRQRSAERF